MDLSFSSPLQVENDTPPTPRREVRLVGRVDGAAGRWAARPEFDGAPVCSLAAWPEGPVGLALVAVEDVSAVELLEFVAARADQDGWLVGVLVEGSDQLRLLSSSPVSNAGELLGWAAENPDAPVPLDLRSLLKAFSIARHDLNNPLTSALAETQLALMDEPGGELQEALETVQRQLRRMRDQLRDLSPYRWR